ncbi:MAG TPA: SMC-Scp complex subunit ScpB [Candidatus Paceibacterota bacterium]|nr:SMC-Scp complex subunit ScpB [Candidatus Paceibacterota bacterium]
MEGEQDFVSVSAKVEAVLFYKNEPVSVEELAETLEISLEEVRTALNELDGLLKERGIVLLRTENTVALGTTPGVSALIEKIRKQELSGSLGKAALETLAIVLYRGPISRAEIDYVRGVHSPFILRRLTMRGLVEKIPHPDQKNSYLYQTTVKLLAHLGISRLDDLPEYEKIRKEFLEIENSDFEKNTASKSSEKGDIPPFRISL